MAGDMITNVRCDNHVMRVTFAASAGLKGQSDAIGEQL
jgi:hypothetical protein